ncbi:MAG: hypothetical protein CLLPBCKN_002395 [Chroococcidiopsis cubana SAG 39.79]|uniref:Pentapeptide repeat protein n=2 Tax=Chroococcidiopsis TaxID=54298 RepID=A0AB37UFE6_9CYAN|nr:hypothetical protein [Chroococcidiopsis cubana SAG 39.79]PSB63690.1 hypothetical protein C7B79_12940 [Chroococcidiopsis cubana CCALA 043]RUT09506.1 hypothetical protein DSM107010_44380 [Chroococcidiopsis cubana SAG 39.79]
MDLKNFYFHTANLSNADFRGTNLSNANLFGANLVNTNLSNANLSNSLLCFVKWGNTNLNGAIVKGARFDDDYWLSETQRRDLIERGAIFIVHDESKSYHTAEDCQ